MTGFRLSMVFGCILLLAGSAHASQITFTFDFGRLQTGSYSLNRGSLGWLAEGVYAGKGTATVIDGGLSPYLQAGQSFDTYCVDLLHNINSGESPQVTIGFMKDWAQENIGASNPGSYPWPNNPYAGQAAAYLYNTYAKDGLGQSDKIYREAGLQIAIWEVLYEGGASGTNLSFSLNSGDITFAGFDSKVTGFATSYLNGIPRYGSLSGSNALWLQTANQGTGLGSHTQDFVGPNPVPEPASIVLVGSGIILIGGAAFRKWKNAK